MGAAAKGSSWKVIHFFIELATVAKSTSTGDPFNSQPGKSKLEEEDSTNSSVRHTLTFIEFCKAQHFWAWAVGRACRSGSLLPCQPPAGWRGHLSRAHPPLRQTRVWPQPILRAAKQGQYRSTEEGTEVTRSCTVDTFSVLTLLLCCCAKDDCLDWLFPSVR